MAVKQAAGTAEEGAVAAFIAASAALLKRRRDGPPKNVSGMKRWIRLIEPSRPRMKNAATAVTVIRAR